jgi:hypothetical protein
MGWRSGTPYTAVEEISTTRRTPASSAAAKVTAAPSTLTERIEARLAWIGSAAAAWTSTSAPATRRRAWTVDRTSPGNSSTRPSSSTSSSGATSSVRTAWPSAIRRRERCRPRKPAPPEIATSTSGD